MEEDIRDGSIAKSGWSKFAIYPAECGLPSVFFFFLFYDRKEKTNTRGHKQKERTLELQEMWRLTPMSDIMQLKE